MRLICPNCDAQYEVPDEVMPVDGRDVQCSNCGQTWFQHHPDNAAEEDEEQTLDVDAPAPDEETSPPPPPAPPAVAAPTAPERKQLDPAVADILRQEAEAEQEARRKQQSEPLESQPDLGLDSNDSDDVEDHRTRQAQERMARMRGEPQPVSDATATAAAISSRRDLLPDIEEINSTLRTGKNRDDGASGNGPDIEAPTMQRRKRGFRNGFLLMIVLFAVMFAIYAFAPQIARAVPQVDPYLSGYVAWVDKLRLALDGYVQGFLGWLDAMASQSDA